jgi:hypothetical protein
MRFGGLDLRAGRPDPDEAMARLLLEWILPAWTAIGALDWYAHVRTDIEHTAGLPENLIHDAMFAQTGVPILLALTCETNRPLIMVMTALLLTHQATAYYDASFALHRRKLTIWEQHVHSFFEVLPFAAIAIVAGTHVEQLKTDTSRGIRLRGRQMPLSAFAAIGGMIVLSSALYANEFWRCLRVPRSRRHRESSPDLAP